jgi:hypothetical protein
MKSHNNFRILCLSLVAGILLQSLSGRTTLTPAVPRGNKGDVTKVGVHFSSEIEVVGASFVIEFDPAILSPGGIQKGTALDDHEIFDEQDDDSGKITLTLLSMKNKAFASGELVTISFNLLADLDEDTDALRVPEENTLLVTKAGEQESYEAIQRINELFFRYAADLEAAKPSTGREVSFTAADDGSDAAYEWDFGDGTIIPGKEVAHKYEEPDSYLITLTASNFLGSKTTTQRLSVSAPYWALDAKDEGDGWKSFDWFGFYYETQTPWIYHETLGWLYREGETVDNTWLWSDFLDWAWTGDLVYPYLYREGHGWLYYLKGSKDPTRFYDYKEAAWK